MTLAILAPSLAWAEDDPPGVARVSLVEGPASYRLRDGDDWTGVAINAPLVTGDKFYSGKGGRAEIQLAPGVYLRLGAETQIDLVEVAGDAAQVSIPTGYAILRLREDPRNRHVEIDTPSVALTLKRAGSYRVDVDSAGATTVRVGRGEANAYVGEDQVELFAHSSAFFDPVGGATSYRAIAHLGDDDFDRWEHDRNDRVESSQSYQHVSSDIYGVEDLDDHGVWEYQRGYGHVWRPTTVQVGWAPYREGRWTWVEPWGWTWLDYAAWGWAPFHYGRWVQLNSSWYWAPGTVIARPAYAPALVGFYGYGGGYGYGASVSVGIGRGYVGWVPLGWGEPCYPWWGGFGGVRSGYAWWGGWGGPRVVNNVVIKQKNIYNINVRDVRHVNRRHPGGFTKVERGEFGRGGRMVPVGERERRGFRAVSGRVGVTPDRSSRRAVRPARQSVGRNAQPRDATGRSGMRRAGITERSSGRGRTARARDESGIGRSSERSSRTQLASGGETSKPSAREPAVARGRGVARDSSPGAASRVGRRDSVVPRPPSRTEQVGSSSAPRRFARRSQPYVARRPSFSPSGDRGTPAGSSRRAVADRATSGSSRLGSSRAGTSSPSRRGVGSSTTASSGRRDLGRAPRSSVGSDGVRRASSSSARRSTARRAPGERNSSAIGGRVSARSSGTSGTRASAGRGGGARASVSSRSRAARAQPRISSSAGKTARPVVSSARASSGGRRAFSSGSRSSGSLARKPSSGGRSMTRGIGRASGGGRSFGGGRSSGRGSAGRSGRGRVGVGRR